MKIYRKEVHACGHCPEFVSRLIYNTKGEPERARNSCDATGNIVFFSDAIPPWCPLVDLEEEGVK